jgi:cytoskeletal protein CcmA (bactofilin family)
MSTGSIMRDPNVETSGATSGEESIIDQSSMFDGVLRTSRNLRVEGQAKGQLYCEGTLYVEEGAQVEAQHIVAANVVIAGTLTGDVTCHGRLQILPTGRVSGRIATVALAIQEGAIYEGELRMSNVDEELAPGEDTAAVEVTSTTPESAAPAAPAAPSSTTAVYGINMSRRGGREGDARGEPKPPPGEPEESR